MIFAVGSKLLSLLLFFIIICFVIAWHELGHLLVAKKCNVYCYEYSIGFGPILYRNKKRETHFVIRAIPLGGFVKMAGEDGDEFNEVLKDNDGNEIPKNRILANISKGKKIGVMVAGGVMNMILAIVCFYIFIAFNGGFVMGKTDSRIMVQEDSLLSEKGMESGDKIVEIITSLHAADGNVVVTEMRYSVNKISEVTNALNYAAPQQDGQVQQINISYLDQSEENQLNTITVKREAFMNEEGSLEISKIGLSQYYVAYHYNAFSALWGSFHLLGETFLGTCNAFLNIFKGDLSSLSGLVGIYETVDSVATGGTMSVGARLVNVIYLTGAISFSLGFFNLIPFPALDGGRVVFVLYSMITKKKVNPNVEATIHFVGLVLLFGLMIFINIKDILRLFCLL